MEKFEHYIYVYLDPRKPGQFFYKDMEFKFQPFYIGLGKKRRDISHIKEARDYFKYSKEKRDRLNDYKIAILRLLDKNGLEPIILRIKEGLSREQAIEEEIKLIAYWGRKSTGNGILSNMTPGGESPLYRMTEKQKKNISKWWKCISPNGKEYIVKGLKNFCDKHGLNYNSMRKLAKGLIHSHKAWNCYEIVNGKTIVIDKRIISKEEQYGDKFKKSMSKALKGREFSEEHKKALRKPKSKVTITDKVLEARKRGAEKCKGQKRMSITKNWEFISPNGISYKVKGMKNICDKFSLIPAAVSTAIKKNLTYKKWRIKELPADYFELNPNELITF